MTSSQPSGHWQTKGFGWIPDLPDITDPDLTLALDRKTHIVSDESTDYLETIAENLALLLQGRGLGDSKPLADLYKQLLGDTQFPHVQVYKILRRTEQTSNNDVSPLQQSQAKEVVQLKQALYWIYKHKKFSQTDTSSSSLEARPRPEEWFPEDSIRLLGWLQSPNFDARLESIVKYFQRHHDLVTDGIVGLRTYAVINTKLANPTQAMARQNIDLLCPSSIISHDILSEVFQHLTYLWLLAKFNLSIKAAFQYFLGQYSLTPNQSDCATRIKAELDFIVYEELKGISFRFRQAIKSSLEISTGDSTQNHAIKCLEKDLSGLQKKLLCRFQEIAIATYQNLGEQFHDLPRENVASGGDFSLNPVLPIFQELNEILTLSLRNLIDPLVTHNSPESVLAASFIVYDDKDFIKQFHTWFHVIEPFVSAIFQILSPLASFDNYRQAVSTGFEKLDSCFQLYQLENASKVAAYKNLILGYSSAQTSDRVEELQGLRRTIVALFEETLAKIDRVRGENLNYRPYILDTLEVLLKDHIKVYFRSSKRCKLLLADNWRNYPKEIPSASTWPGKIWDDFAQSLDLPLAEEEKTAHKDRIQALATLFIQARLAELADSLDGSNLDDNADAYANFVAKELARDRSNVNAYLEFFDFIKDIINEKYGVRINLKHCPPHAKPAAHVDGNATEQTSETQPAKGGIDAAADQATNCGSGGDRNRTEAELISFLTSKKELFEIKPLDHREVDAAQTPATECQALLFEPAILQLPINTNLMQKVMVPRPAEAKSQTPKGAPSTRSYFFLPGLVDLSYWCPPVEDQEDINACTAFAGVSLLEYFAQKRYGKYINLSARFLYKTARNLMNRSDDGGASVRQTMKALVLFGVPPQEVWPWQVEGFNEEPPPFCYAYAQSYQALKYFRLDAASSGGRDTSISARELLLFQIKAVLAAGLPCIFGFTVYSSFYGDKNIRLGHIPYPSSRDQMVGGHAAVAVGYNDYKRIDRVDGRPSRPGAVLIRNSWGRRWGTGGYGWMPYEYILEGLTADWWSLLKSEWFDGGAFGLGAVDSGSVVPPPPKGPG